MKVKKDSKKGSLATGYALKSVPSWVFNIIKSEMRLQKFGKKSRKRVCPLVVMPKDFWKTRPSTKGKKVTQNPMVMPATYRLKKTSIAKKYLNIDDTTIKEISGEVSKKFTKDWGGHPRLIPIIFPNDVVSGRVKSCSESKSELIIGAYSKSTRGEYWHFIDDVETAGGQRSYTLRCRMPVYEVEVMINNVRSIVYSPNRKFDEGKEYDFVVFRWFEPLSTMTKGTKDNPIYLCFDAKEVKEDYTDMFASLEKVTGYEYLAPNWAYDETTTMLILFDVMYMERNNPAINLVLFGGPRLGKTSVLDVFSRVFSEELNSGTQQTVAGLAGSFYGDKPQAGGMMDSKFVFLGDEFFRTGLKSSQAPDSNHINALLHGVMEHLEHREKKATSGKYTRRIFFDKSFLAINNIRNFDAFEEAFQKDPAPFNRLTFCMLPKEVEKAIREGDLIASMNFVNIFHNRLGKVGLNMKTFRKMLKYMRQSLRMVNVDMRKMNSYIKMGEYCHQDFEKGEKMLAFVKCACLFNHVFRNKRPFPLKNKITATDNDYRVALDVMERVVRDTKQVCGLP